jgi:hypothetical protein
MLSSGRYSAMSQNLGQVPSVNLLQAIQVHCLQCSNNDWNEVVNCYGSHCLLHAYRLNKNSIDDRVSDVRRKVIKDFAMPAFEAVLKIAKNVMRKNVHYTLSGTDDILH